MSVDGGALSEQDIYCARWAVHLGRKVIASEPLVALVEQVVESEPITRYTDIAHLSRVMNGKTKRHNKSTSTLRPPFLILASEHQQYRHFIPTGICAEWLD